MDEYRKPSTSPEKDTTQHLLLGLRIEFGNIWIFYRRILIKNFWEFHHIDPMMESNNSSLLPEISVRNRLNVGLME